MLTLKTIPTETIYFTVTVHTYLKKKSLLETGTTFYRSS